MTTLGPLWSEGEPTPVVDARGPTKRPTKIHLVKPPGRRVQGRSPVACGAGYWHGDERWRPPTPEELAALVVCQSCRRIWDWVRREK